MKIKYFLFIASFIISINCNFYSQTKQNEVKWELLFSGLEFPEGPTFDNEGNLYVSDCYGNRIVRYDGFRADTFLTKSNSTPSMNSSNGLVFAGNLLFACDFGSGSVLVINKNKEILQIIENYKGERFNRPNDIIFDGKENIIFTDPKSYSKEILDGRVFSFNINTYQVKQIADQLAFPNGLSISPSDNKIYICESAKESIYRYDFNEEGILVNKELFINLPGGDPDGIDFDNNGNLYVAHFGGKAVYIVSPSGKIIDKIETPGKKPTNIEFADTEKKVLILTEVETNSVYKIALNSIGLK